MLSEGNVSLHTGNKVLPCWTESFSSSPAAAQRTTVDLSCAPAGEPCAGLSCARAGGEALVRGWPGGGPRASDSHVRTTMPSDPSEVGISEEEPPGALLDGRGSESQLSCLPFHLSTLLHARPEVFLNDETECGLLGHPKPAFSEQTEHKKMPSHVKRTSAYLQITLGLLAPPALEGANPLCNS
ncbi:LOW QUALITY PROTEIN: protein FAM220A-like [Crocuta crocuta]